MDLEGMVPATILQNRQSITGVYRTVILPAFARHDDGDVITAFPGHDPSNVLKSFRRECLGELIALEAPVRRNKVMGIPIPGLLHRDEDVKNILGRFDPVPYLE